MSPNLKYQSGRRFEYRVAKYFEQWEWLTFRSAGSHGCADIIAFKQNESPILIQCKVGHPPLSLTSYKSLIYWGVGLGVHILLVVRGDKRRMEFYEPDLNSGIFKKLDYPPRYISARDIFGKPRKTPNLRCQ